MKTLFITLVSVLFFLVARPAAAELIVIVNPANPTSQLKREQVVDIYMGRYTHFPNGLHAKALDLPADSTARTEYYQKLINKSVAQVNTFWARLLFTGRAKPPRELSDTHAVMLAVMKDPEAIAYIDSQFLNDKVKVVYRLP